MTSKPTVYVADLFVEPNRLTIYSMATSCPVSCSTTSLPADISILGTADSKSSRRRLQFRCLSMVYCSGIHLRSQLSCKSMSELLSYLLSKLYNLLNDYGSCSVNFTMHLLCADTTILLSLSAAKEAPSPPTSTFSIITLLSDPRDSSLKHSR